jgi:hypothetical protein
MQTQRSPLAGTGAVGVNLKLWLAGMAMPKGLKLKLLLSLAGLSLAMDAMPNWRVCTRKISSLPSTTAVLPPSTNTIQPSTQTAPWLQVWPVAELHTDT